MAVIPPPIGRLPHINLSERDALLGVFNDLGAEKVIIEVNEKIIHDFHDKFCNNFHKVDYSRLSNNLVSY